MELIEFIIKANLEKGNLDYENRQNGTPESFHGIESIDEDGKRVHVLYYFRVQCSRWDTFPFFERLVLMPLFCSHFSPAALSSSFPQ